MVILVESLGHVAHFDWHRLHILFVATPKQIPDTQISVSISDLYSSLSLSLDDRLSQNRTRHNRISEL